MVRLCSCVLIMLLMLKAQAQDVTFAESCLQETTSFLVENPRLADSEVLSLQMLAQKNRSEAAVYNELLQSRKVTFPGGTTLDMGSTGVVSSRGMIWDDYAKVFNLKTEDLPRIAQEQQKGLEYLYKMGRFLDMSFDEYLIYRSYKESGFKKINRILRWHEFLSLEEEKAFVTICQYLNSILNRIESYKGLVYRGASLAPEVIEQMVLGRVFSFRTYLSTSMLRPIPLLAKKENQVTFILHSQNGRPVELLDFYNRSIKSYEAEVLFKPGAIFKILKVEKTSEGVTKIYAKEL